MPMMYVPPKTNEGEKTKRVLFWIQSSRGTNNAKEMLIPESHYRDGYLKGEVEEWCEQFGAWHHGENSVSYGWATCTCRKREGHSAKCEISGYIKKHNPTLE